MKYLAIVLVALSLTSCSIAKHTQTTTREVRDTTVVHQSDSTATHEFVDSSASLYLDSATITVVLDSDTVAKAVDTFKQKDIQVIHDVVKAVAGKQKVKSVTVSIHGLAKTTTKITIDSTIHVLKRDSSHAHVTVNTVQKTVERTSYIIFSIAAFLFISIIIVIKFKFL